jgi:hypothetical protein
LTCFLCGISRLTLYLLISEMNGKYGRGDTTVRLGVLKVLF